MEELERVPLKPSRPATPTAELPKSDHNNVDWQEFIEQALKQDDLNKILEKFTAPLFYFTTFQGQRLAFGLKNGEVVVGTVGLQRWQFLRLENVIVTSRGVEKKHLKWRMININRVDYFEYPEEEEGPTVR